MKKLVTIAWVLIALFAISSCGEDEPDFRDDLIGTYVGSTVYYEFDNGEEDQGSISSSAIVSKGSTEGVLNVIIKDIYGVEHLFFLENYEEASDGYAFVMRTQNDGGTIYSGAQEYYLSSVQNKKDAVISTELNALALGFKIENVNESYACGYIFEGRKQ